LYDMSGNVWEWCWDRSGDLVSFAHFCGGSFGSNDDESKVNSKSRAYPWDRGCALGFRIVRSVK
ncbi:MAG: SUMF1/EgtB/PvdO family nonheme iron enzyme, partial [Treponemataceae bacterium]|nr:SUMF1/EgtB/PvdO family nonheme iron enzyme [Treponemataceae bacterium]